MIIIIKGFPMRLLSCMGGQIREIKENYLARHFINRSSIRGVFRIRNNCHVHQLVRNRNIKYIIYNIILFLIVEMGFLDLNTTYCSLRRPFFLLPKQIFGHSPDDLVEE